jgi:hypothetical protein
MVNMAENRNFPKIFSENLPYQTSNNITNGQPAMNWAHTLHALRAR